MYPVEHIKEIFLSHRIFTRTTFLCERKNQKSLIYQQKPHNHIKEPKYLQGVLEP